MHRAAHSLASYDHDASTDRPLSSASMSGGGSMSELEMSDALLAMQAKVEQVLSLQMQLERCMSELISGQANTQQSVLDLTQCLGKPLPGDVRSPVVPNILNAETEMAEIVKSLPAASILNETNDMPEREVAEDMGVHLRQMTSSALRGGGSRRTPSSAALQRLSMLDDIAMAANIDEDDVDEKLEQFLGSRHPSMNSSVKSHNSLLTEITGKQYMMDPHSKVRIAHDLFSIIVLALDVITAPMILAWNLDVKSSGLLMLNIISLSFWSVDIVMSFITGFYVQGELESRPVEVAKRYLKSWFSPDIIIVLADLTTLCLSGSSDTSRGSGSGVLRVSKASRFLRLARLCRLARISDAFARLMEANVYLEIIVETVKPVLAIILVNHILACCWWSISQYLPSDTGLYWKDETISELSGMTYMDSSMLFQYLTCVHWSLTQLTPGSMEVVPRNSFERFFNCASLLLGMVVFSSLISSISAKMMQHYLKQKDKLMKLTSLRRFLSNKVSSSIVIAAQFQANKAMFGNTGKPVTVNEVAAMSMLPKALQRSIQVELCMKHLQHPLLRWWFLVDPKGAQALCHNAIDFIGLAAEDHLFFPRAVAVGAYVMTRGMAKYIIDNEEIPKGLGRSSRDVPMGRFFCEAALWCKWKHVGELTAAMGCEILLVRTADLIKCLDQEMVVKHVVVQYGRSYYARLLNPMWPDREMPNDLTVAFTEFDSILPSLPAHCRQLIGAVAVKAAKQRSGGKDVTDATAAEVRQGTCCLMVNWEGEVERIVSIIVLRLSRPDGKVLVRLGTFKGGEIQVSCEMPGKKQKEGESPGQAFDRLFQGAFAPLAHAISITGASVEETWKESKRMHIKTKYLRTVNHATINIAMECLGLEVTQSLPRRSRRTSFVSVASSIASLADFNDIDEIKICALADEVGEITLVGWLSAEDLRFFTSPAGESCLQNMMDAVHLSEEDVEAAITRYSSSQEAEFCTQRGQVCM